MDSSKKFLSLPEYPGGSEALRKFISDNLKYPEEAAKNNIEGIVHLNIEIDDNGKVLNVSVERGIGYGCDEEAVRIAKLMKFGKVKNRGLRLKAKKKIRIPFRLPEKKAVSYTVKKAEKESQTDDNKKSGDSYSYTINF